MRAIGMQWGTAPALIPVAEDQIHIAILEWLRAVLPGALVVHVPNGGRRGKREAGLFKRLGVVAGIPDLIVFMDGAFVFALEVKAPRGVVSKAQESIHTLMRSLGFHVAVVRSIDDARVALAEWKIATRESKQ